MFKDWISVDERVPDEKEVSEVMVLWKEHALEDNLLPVMVSNTTYFLKNLKDFSHWTEIPDYSHIRE